MTIPLITDYVLRVLVVLLFGIISLKKKLVDTTGFIAGLFVGLSVILLGGWNWFITLLLFHLVAGIATKWKYEHKRSLGVAEEKGGARSWKNVLANGIVASIAVILEYIIGGQIWAYAYLAAVATAMGDTLATEIGLLSPSKPRLIVKPWIKVEPGASGGVSLLGYIASALAGSIIGLIGYVLSIVPSTETPSPNPLYLTGVITLATLIGVTIDSVIGATIQAQYRCTVCGKLTERSIHCGKQAILIKGIRLIDNHIVNILGIVSGALSAMIIVLLV